jgi:hypothetical protein
MIKKLKIPKQMLHSIRDGAEEDGIHRTHLIYCNVLLNATKSLQRLSWQLETNEICT